MPSRQEKQIVTKLVANKFSSTHRIESRSSSPNGHHFVLTKDGEKKHLKVINRSSAEREGLNEIHLLEAVTSPNVINLEEYGNLDSKFTYLIFPHIDGQTLDKLKTDSGWPSNELLKVAKDVSRAIEDIASAGIVHRDIKPKNIIKEEESGKYIVLDLGIGYFVDQVDRDNTKARGSREFSSPEQFKSITSGDDDISFASDHFSLGTILYLLASNKHPFGEYKAEKYSTMGEAICKMPAQAISALRADLNDNLMNVIMRLLQKNPSKRFWTPIALTNALLSRRDDEVQNLEFYISDPKSMDFLEDYLGSVDDTHKPTGILLPINASDDRLRRAARQNLDILLDPETYKLPYPKASQKNTRKKLRLPDGAKYTAAKLNDDKFVKEITEKVVRLQARCSGIILPYFAITTLEDGLIEINRKVEDIYFDQIHSDSETRNIYAGIMIPYELIVDVRSRTKLMDRLMKLSKVDGYYVLLENPDDSPFILEDHDYLSGANELLALLKSKGHVIVAKADLAFIPILKHGIVVTSPDKSHRCYSFENKLTNPKPQDGSTPEEKWQLRYYVEPLFNFIEEKATLESLESLGLEPKLKCDCPYCEAVKPFDAATEKSHDDARRHFYYRMAGLINSLSGKAESDVRTVLLNLLKGAAEISNEITLKTAGSERYSTHERLIEII